MQGRTHVSTHLEDVEKARADTPVRPYEGT
jgi:hypothetical protein